MRGKMGTDPSFDLLFGHWASDSETLDMAATKCVEHLVLSCRFNPFSKSFKPEPFGHRKDRGNHFLLFAVLVYTRDKASVDLDPFDAVAADRSDRSVPGSKIIEIQAATQFSQF